jgi:hypothetical protein
MNALAATTMDQGVFFLNEGTTFAPVAKALNTRLALCGSVARAFAFGEPVPPCMGARALSLPALGHVDRS